MLWRLPAKRWCPGWWNWLKTDIDGFKEFLRKFLRNFLQASSPGFPFASFSIFPYIQGLHYRGHLGTLSLSFKDIFRQVDERAREAGSVILIAEIYHSKNEDEKAGIAGCFWVQFPSKQFDNSSLAPPLLRLNHWPSAQYLFNLALDSLRLSESNIAIVESTTNQALDAANEGPLCKKMVPFVWSFYIYILCIIVCIIYLMYHI